MRIPRDFYAYDDWRDRLDKPPHQPGPPPVVTIYRPVCLGCGQPCDDGMSCDRDDGTCKCGGAGGVECSSGEVCVSTPFSYACRLACSEPRSLVHDATTHRRRAPGSCR